MLIAGTAIAFPTHPAHAFAVHEVVIVFITLWAGRGAGFLTLGSLTMGQRLLRAMASQLNGSYVLERTER